VIFQWEELKMTNDALILLAASVKAQLDVLERFLKFIEQECENETLRAENAELRRRLSEGADK
jgi:hypothetical protein